MKRLFDRRGWLTPYAMSCGYSHRTEIGAVTVRFAQRQNDARDYEVDVYDPAARGSTNCDTGATLRDGIASWRIFPRVEDARRAYRREIETRGASLGRRFESAQDARRNVIA